MDCETVQRAEALELLRGVVERHPFFIAWVIIKVVCFTSDVFDKAQ